MDELSNEAKDLETSLFGFPGTRRVVTTNKVFREVMLARDGLFLLNGKQWTIRSKPAGAGLRRVWLALDTED